MIGIVQATVPTAISLRTILNVAKAIILAGKEDDFLKAAEKANAKIMINPDLINFVKSYLADIHASDVIIGQALAAKTAQDAIIPNALNQAIVNQLAATHLSLSNLHDNVIPEVVGSPNQRCEEY